jgi:signal peptidase I
MIILRWLISRTVRQACDMRRHVLRLVKAQQDLLKPQGIEAIQQSAEDLHQTMRAGQGTTAILEKMKQLEDMANKWLKPYPNASIRENVEVILVAVAVAMAFRTFFLQPMKIPTGSMQPTLYGVTCDNLKTQPSFKLPTGFQKFVDSWFYGIAYYNIVAEGPGELQAIEQPKQVFPFIKKQRFMLGNRWYTIWFPPSILPARPGVPNEQLIFYHAGIEPGMQFRTGDDIIKLKVLAGDHLFVNRMVFNFRKPQRGDIVIFETTGIPDLQQDTYYIKRLVATGGERVQIGNDQHMIINGQRLDASTPHFEFVYTFAPTPQENTYFGHVNGTVGAKFNRPGIIAPLFHSETNVLTVRPHHFMVFGDNTLNSYDSRYWGDFPEEKVIGKSGFVYWPISSRFGWGYR